MALGVLILAQLAAAGEPELFRGAQVPPPNDRLHVQTVRDLRVTAAVPSAQETLEIFGVNLYLRNVQPVWVQVENLSNETLFLAPMGIDRTYFTPRETLFRALAILRGREDELVRLMEQKTVSRLRIEPNTSNSGYVFTNLDEGTKTFNVDVTGEEKSYLTTFFIPVPGLRLDHHEVDMDSLYAPGEIRDVTLAELVRTLESMPCCVTDKQGRDKGDPLNLVFIGEPRQLYYAFMRAGWDETETIYGASLLKTAASALTGGRYRYSPVSALFVFGRAQDAALQKARSSIHERNHLRVWMTPLRHEGKPVWIGQISRDIGVRFTWRTITTHKIDPDVDETREYLLEDLAYAQSLAKFGYVGGVGAASYDAPRGNLTGDPYFTDGLRVVLWVAEEPSDIGEIERLDLAPYRGVEPSAP
jgi:hypothetical protein